MLKDVASLEILQAPGLTFKIPELFNSIPRLTGTSSMLASDPADSVVSGLGRKSAQSILQSPGELPSGELPS